ncbi:Phytochrome-like protein cph2 [compost metagenome]
MREHSEYILQLSRDLREALQHEQLELHYQLQFDLKSLTPCGLEALIRWRDNSGTVITPDKFLPIAQTYGLMPDLNKWVLRQACLDNAKLIRDGLLDVRLEVVTKHTRALHRVGISLSMDDFGTGYSSLSRLRNLKFNKVKIDRSFVKELSANKPGQVIIPAILGIAHALNMRVVAEGIESQTQLDWLREKGCEQGQGYWLARPLPLDKLITWLNTHT